LLRRVLIIAVGLVFGAGASQAPEFIQQYTQRLGGWRDAYMVDVAELDASAKKLSQTRENYIAALRANPKPEAREEGDRWARKVAYLKALEIAYSDLTGASSWSRVPVFIQHYNPELAYRTWNAYKPAIPTTLEGGVYGAAGFVIGWLLVIAGGLPYRIWQDRRMAATRKKKFEGLDPL